MLKLHAANKNLIAKRGAVIKMRTILLVGSYFPIANIETILMHYLACDLKLRGYRLILVSDAWCKVESDMFVGTAKDLASDNVFDKKYYLDPLQVSILRRENGTTNMLYGLICNVVRSECVNDVLIIDMIPYGYYSTLLKNEFPMLNIHLYVGSASWFISLYEPYEKACLKQALRNYTSVFCAPEAYKGLKQAATGDNLYCAFPFSVQKARSSAHDQVIGISWVNTKQELAFIRRMIQKCPIKTKYLVIGKNVFEPPQITNQYTREMSTERLLSLVEACQTVILLDTFSNVYFPSAYLCFTLLGNSVVTTSEFAETLQKCGHYGVSEYSGVSDAIELRMLPHKDIPTIANLL